MDPLTDSARAVLDAFDAGAQDDATYEAIREAIQRLRSVLDPVEDD